MGALIPNRSKDKARDVAVLFGRSMQDHREELFVVMVCDGLPLGLAFRRAGFESKAHDAPANLFNLPRIQERANAILAARRETGAVTLPQVTSMLQRVFASAHAAEEFSAAHNAAFSLARIYGHVTDKSVIEHIRRPSRDPDAPSETALEAWAASLPLVEDLSKQGQKAPLDGAPAPLLGPEPAMLSADNIEVDRGQLGCYPDATPSQGPSDKSQQYQALSTDAHVLAQHVGGENKVDWLGPDGGRMAIGNEAPVGPVTGTPHRGGRSTSLERGAQSTSLERGGGAPLFENGSPSADEGTGTAGGASDNREKVAIEGGPMSPNVKWPKIEDLF